MKVIWQRTSCKFDHVQHINHSVYWGTIMQYSYFVWNSTIPSYLFSHCKLRYHPLNFSQIKNKLNCHFLLVIGRRRTTCKELLVFSGLTLTGICSNLRVYLDIVLTPVQFHIFLVYRLCMRRIEYKDHKALRC